MRYAVVGGGILGASVARHLLQRQPESHVTLFEKEAALALHQTGRNSGVVHAGLYYVPGSLKARLCRRGVTLLREFCEEHSVAYVECGKVLVALNDVEDARLTDIVARAQRNGVPRVRRLDRGELRELEPNVAGISGLHSPTTAIVDFAEVTRRLAADAQTHGAVVRTSAEVSGLTGRGASAVVTVGADDETFDDVVICAGLQGDRLAAMAGGESTPRIVPFRGEYYRLRPERRHVVRGLVYPVPDPRYPFLGVHLTPRVDGEVLIGPNAVLSLAREKYGRHAFSGKDLADMLGYRGFRQFAREHWRTGLQEMHGSISKRAFMAGARRYVPDLADDDVLSGPAGIRAQAVDVDGSLVDDFRIARRGRVLAVRNAPSPAATSSLAIAEHVVRILLDETPVEPTR